MFNSNLQAAIATALVTATLGVSSLIHSDEPKQETAPAVKKVDEATIRALINQLGDESYSKREAASKRLEAIGEPARALLQKSAKDAPDAEVRSRAGELARMIGKLLLQEVRSYEGHAIEPQRKATRVVVSPDGRFAVSAGSGMLRYWDIEAGKQLLAFGPITHPSYWALALSKDGKRVIAGGEDNLAQVFDLPSGKKVQQFAGHTASVRGAVLMGDGKRAVTAAWDQSIRLWDVETGKEILTFDNMDENVRGLALAPNGKTLASASCRVIDGSPGTVRLWDIETGKMLRGMEGHTENVSSVCFAPDGKTLLSSGTEGSLRLWDTASGKELKQLIRGAHRLEFTAFTPDGRRILACGGTATPTVRMWDVASENIIAESDEMGGGFLCVTALPDNHRCLTASRDGLIRLWQWKQ